MSEEQQMRKVIFAINITIDGYCGHESMMPPTTNCTSTSLGSCVIQTLKFSDATRIT